MLSIVKVFVPQPAAHGPRTVRVSKFRGSRLRQSPQPEFPDGPHPILEHKIAKKRRVQVGDSGPRESSAAAVRRARNVDLPRAEARPRQRSMHVGSISARNCVVPRTPIAEREGASSSGGKPRSNIARPNSARATGPQFIGIPGGSSHWL